MRDKVRGTSRVSVANAVFVTTKSRSHVCLRPGTSSRPTHHRRDVVGHGLHVGVLPNTNDGPTSCGQRLVRLSVARSSPLELRRPERAVRLRSRSMLRTRVPEASVDKDCQLGPRKYDVGCSSKPDERPAINEVPKSSPMKRSPKPKLRLGVPTSVRLHRPPSSGRGSPTDHSKYSPCSPKYCGYKFYRSGIGTEYFLLTTDPDCSAGLPPPNY